MSDLDIALILRLVDQVSAPARAVIGTVREIGNATEQAGRRGMAWADRQLEATAARRAALQGEALGIAATGYALYEAMRPAVEFEQAMSGVARVVEFDRPESFQLLQQDILDLTTSGGLPMAAEGIAAIIEAAGQAGVIDEALPDAERREALIAFARDAAQMGTAFDMSAEAAGSAMTLWRVTLGMSRDEAMGFGDAINHLSNNMDATAPEIVEMVRRTGAFAQAAGLAESHTAALSAALLAGGAAPQVASTAMQNLITTLTAGEAATPRQVEIFEALGLSAENMAERMQVDAQGAIQDVMLALAELPEHLQISSLTQLFGRESADAIAPLLANVELLEQAFGLVSDPTEYAGSMMAEYEVQAANTANQLQITMNFLRGMAVTVGSVLLPELNELLKIVQPVVQMVTDWAAAHPELISLLARVTVGILAFRAASLVLRWGLLSLLTPVLHLIRGGSWMIAMLPRVAAALLALLNPMAWVRGAIWAIRTAFIASGIGLLLAGIAMAGVWIYNNWAGLKQFFIGVWEGFRDAIGPAGPALDWVIERVERLWAWLTDLLGPVDATKEEWRSWGVVVGEAIGGAVAWVAEWISTGDGLLSGIGKLLAGWVALRVAILLLKIPFMLIASLISFLLGGPFRLLLSGVKGLGRAFGLFQGTVSREMGTAVSTADQAVSNMNRSFARLRLTGFLASVQAAMLISRVPTDPDERAAWQWDNAQTMETGFRNTPVLGQLMSGYDRAFEWVHGRPAPTVASRRAEAENTALTGLPDELRDAVALLRETLDIGLPDTSALERQAQVLRDQIATGERLAQSRGLEGDPEFVARMTGLREELASVEAEMTAMDDRSTELSAALALLSDTDVAPEVDRESIERALEAAVALNRNLREIPQVPSSPIPDATPGIEGARDAGGPVRAGLRYLVGERGAELFVPRVDGAILPARTLRAAATAAAMATPVAAMPSPATLIDRVDRRPPLASQVAHRSETRIEVGQIVVQAVAGQDPAEIARAVRRELERLADNRRGDLHDGVDF